MIREIDDEPKVGCGSRRGGFRGNSGVCGKAGYDKRVYLCDRCQHKPLADAARTLIALLEEDRAAESGDARASRVSKALGTLRDLYFKEKP